jgi:hypothetical protein
MKEIIKLKTFDGVEHEKKEKAIDYINKLYSVKIRKISDKLLNITECKDMIIFINDNLNMFLELKSIKNDLKIEKVYNEDLNE